MNIYAGLLFQGGHIQDPKLALSLAGRASERAPAGTAAPAASVADPGTQASPSTRRRRALAGACAVALSPFR